MSIEEQIQQLQKRLADWEAEMNELQAEIATSDKDAKVKEGLLSELDALQARRRLAEERLAELRTQEAEAWADDTLLTGILDIFDDIGRRLDAVISRAD